MLSGPRGRRPASTPEGRPGRATKVLEWLRGLFEDPLVGVLTLQPRWRLGGQVVSNPVRIAIVVVCVVTLFYLVVTLASSVAEGG